MKLIRIILGWLYTIQYHDLTRSPRIEYLDNEEHASLSIPDKKGSG
jgi:hypothetical protein